MNGLVSLVDEEDVVKIISTQRKTLRKYEEINELIKKFNDVAEKTYEDAQTRFSSHVKVLSSLKRDLDTIFRRIRALKEKLQSKYPESFEATADAIKSLVESYCIDEEYKEPSTLPSYHVETASVETVESGLNPVEEYRVSQAKTELTKEKTGESVSGSSIDTTCDVDLTIHRETYTPDRNLSDLKDSERELDRASFLNPVDTEDRLEQEILESPSSLSKKFGLPIAPRGSGGVFVEDAETASD